MTWLLSNEQEGLFYSQTWFERNTTSWRGTNGDAALNYYGNSSRASVGTTVYRVIQVGVSNTKLTYVLKQTKHKHAATMLCRRSDTQWFLVVP